MPDESHHVIYAGDVAEYNISMAQSEFRLALVNFEVVLLIKESLPTFLPVQVGGTMVLSKR